MRSDVCTDIVLDTNVLCDVLAQYFDEDTADRGRGRFVARNNICTGLARRLNRLVDDAEEGGLARVVASTAAFVEVAKKWDEIIRGRLTAADLLLVFLQQPPEWFVVAPLDELLLPYFADVPCHITVSRRQESLEWMDAIHAATAYSRGDGALLATVDGTLRVLFHDRLAC